MLTAALRHQVILDTLNNNTIIVNFDLTITAAESFTVGDIKHRLGKPGQKMTWTAYGRPNTSATQPGQFVFAGRGFSIVPAPLGLSIRHPAGRLGCFARSTVRASLDHDFPFYPPVSKPG